MRHVRFNAHPSTVLAHPLSDNTIDNDKPLAVLIGSLDPDCHDTTPNFLDNIPTQGDGVPSAPPPLVDDHDLSPSTLGSDEVPRTSSDPGYYTNCLELWCNRTFHPHGDDSVHTPPPYPAPPGSLFDSQTFIGPEDLNDIPYLQLGSTPPTDSSPAFGDALSTLCHDCLLPHLTCMQVSVVDSILFGSHSSLGDSGANICVTNDPSLLINVIEIDPVPLCMTTSSPDAPTDPTSLCTHKGFLPMALLDSTIHYQPFLGNRHATNTIISPESILHNNHHFHWWTQARHKMPVRGHNQSPDDLSFYNLASQLLLSLPLKRQQGLYYCSNTTFLPDSDASHPTTLRVSVSLPNTGTFGPRPPQYHGPRQPTTRGRQLLSKLWALCLGHCDAWQLDHIPNHTNGIPSSFSPHPFCFINAKEEGGIQKQPIGHSPEKAPTPRLRFFMDFGFIRASTSDYCHPCPGVNRVVKCFEGFTSYLIIVGEAAQYIWVFLRKSKEPPTDLVLDFLALHGPPSGGVIWTDLGGKLAWSGSFWSLLLNTAWYIVKPTGADIPLQNGGAEKWNHTLAVTTCSLLNGSGLPAWTGPPPYFTWLISTTGEFIMLQ